MGCCLWFGWLVDWIMLVFEDKSGPLSKWLLLVSLMCVLVSLYWFGSAPVVFPTMGLHFPPLIPAGKSVITQ